MAKTIKYGSELREKILNGVKKTAEITKKTMGPQGLNVILDTPRGPRITKDGITVIRSLQYKDSFENTALALIREASEKTNSIGDGTTGTCVLAEAVFKEGLKNLNFGVNGIHLRNGIQKAAKVVVEYLRSISKDVKTSEEIRQVAKISSNHSDEIADILTKMFGEIGENGTIRVENGNSTVIESKVLKGMVFDNGYISPYFSTNEEMTFDVENPYIFIVGKKIGSISEIINPLSAISKSQDKRPILVIADGVEGDAISTMVLNVLRGNIRICAVNAPSYGNNKKNMLDDIAILTGGQVISEDTGIAPNDALPDSGILGQAKRVIVTKDSTTIIGGKGSEEKVKERIEQLKNQIKSGNADAWDYKKMQERLAKLDGGVGIISVGANTESERNEKRDLVDDAFCACKAAIAGGVVPGGGSALLWASKNLEKYLNENPDKFTQDEMVGAKILHDSLTAPIHAILENAGESTDLIISKILDGKKPNVGYDVLKKQYGDMVDLEVVDPTNVVIAEVENGSSVASLLLTTAAACVVEPDEEKNKNLIPQMPLA